MLLKNLNIYLLFILFYKNNNCISTGQNNEACKEENGYIVNGTIGDRDYKNLKINNKNKEISFYGIPSFLAEGLDPAGNVSKIDLFKIKRIIVLSIEDFYKDIDKKNKLYTEFVDLQNKCFLFNKKKWIPVAVEFKDSLNIDRFLLESQTKITGNRVLDGKDIYEEFYTMETISKENKEIKIEKIESIEVKKNIVK